jgi:hypothetical protein
MSTNLRRALFAAALVSAAPGCNNSGGTDRLRRNQTVDLVTLCPGDVTLRELEIQKPLGADITQSMLRDFADLASPVFQISVVPQTTPSGANGYEIHFQQRALNDSFDGTTFGSATTGVDGQLLDTSPGTSILMNFLSPKNVGDSMTPSYPEPVLENLLAMYATEPFFPELSQSTNTLVTREPIGDGTVYLRTVTRTGAPKEVQPQTGGGPLQLVDVAVGGTFNSTTWWIDVPASAGDVPGSDGTCSVMVGSISYTTPTANLGQDLQSDEGSTFLVGALAPSFTLPPTLSASQIVDAARAAVLGKLNLAATSDIPAHLPLL